MEDKKKSRKRKFKEVDNDDVDNVCNVTKEEKFNGFESKKKKTKKKNNDEKNIETELIKNDKDINSGLSDLVNESLNLNLKEEDLSLILENFESEKEKSDDRPKISAFYYINANPLTVNDLKNGRRIFNNKTEFSGYQFKENFIEFRQLLFENLMLNSDFTDNSKEQWTMESAIFSTFCYEDDFIEPLIKQHKIKTLIIKHAEGGEKQIDDKDNFLTFIHPKIDFTLKWGKFHSKLTIFKFPTFLRVIIPTANLTNCDWYYWGQLIWFQDFPLKKFKNQTKSDFELYFDKVLLSTLPSNYDYPKKLNFKLSDYDFSDTCVDLIASTSGRFNANQKDDYGIGRLKHLSNSYSKSRKSISNNRLIVQCSSFGKSLKEKFFVDLCEGFLAKPMTNSNTAKIDIIYPTMNYLSSFEMGHELATCLFLNEECFALNKFKFKVFEVKPEFDKCKTVFHSKFIVSTFCTNSNEKGVCEEISDNSFFYFGSHNLSPSAWGSYEKNNTQISMANFELGVIFNPIKLRYEEKVKIFESLIINLNSKYYSNDDKPYLLNEF